MTDLRPQREDQQTGNQQAGVQQTETRPENTQQAETWPAETQEVATPPSETPPKNAQQGGIQQAGNQQAGTGESEASQAIDREVEEPILAFVRDELLTPDMSVGRDDDLLSGELLDSVAVLRLAAWVGEEFDIAMEPADFVVENFQTVAVLAAYVRRATGRDDLRR